MDARLEEGTKAPAFTLLDADGNPVSLEEYLGYKVILYFYPEAMTAGCTTEACDFRDNLSSLKSAGYKVLGVSRDLPTKLREFAERDHLDFELLSDPDRTAHEAYGVWGQKQLYGRQLWASSAQRSCSTRRASSRWRSTTSKLPVTLRCSASVLE